jgi:hypothetical protein
MSTEEQVSVCPDCGGPKDQRSAKCGECHKKALKAIRDGNIEKAIDDQTTNKPLPKDVDSAIAADINRAREAQQARMSAPMAIVGGAAGIEQKQLMKAFAPECLSVKKEVDGKGVWIPGEYHGSFMPAKDYEYYLEGGYEPVVKPKGKGVVKSRGGDILMKIPYKLWVKTEQENSARARFRVSEPSDAAKENPGAVTESMTKG